LLFISVIENAFKHGISYREKSFVDIRMDVTKEMINFRCTNSYFKAAKEIGNVSGIGLDNLKKRLALLFPDCHELFIEATESTFNVWIKIIL
jgi:LytS/YehU family sensor histidine kinase